MAREGSLKPPLVPDSLMAARVLLLRFLAPREFSFCVKHTITLALVIDSDMQLQLAVFEVAFDALLCLAWKLAASRMLAGITWCDAFESSWTGLTHSSVPRALGMVWVFLCGQLCGHVGPHSYLVNSACICLHEGTQLTASTCIVH